MWALSAIALFTASVLALARWLYTRLGSFVVRLQGARRLHFEEAPQLHQRVAHLSIAARIPRPQLYVVRRPQPNAFSLGTGPRASIVILTSAALAKLDEAELCAMLAHELAHIALGHTRRATLVAALAAVMTRALSSGRVLERLHRLGTPPERDFAADRAAAGLLGDALSLAALLTRLKERATRDEPAWFFDAGTPFTATSVKGTFLDERIHQLKRMAAEGQARRAKAILRRSLRRGSRFHPRTFPRRSPGASPRPEARLMAPTPRSPPRLPCASLRGTRT